MADALASPSLEAHSKLLSNGTHAPLKLLETGRNLRENHAGSHQSLRAMFKVDSAVAIYETHKQAEDAVRELQRAGIDMKTLSIAAKEPYLKEHVSGFYTAGDRMLHWGKLGAFWGAIWGFLFDSALFAIPGIGPVLLAGPLVSWVVAVLEGAVVFGGISALGAGLISIGIPQNSVIDYETALKTDKFLLIVHGTSQAVREAKAILRETEHNSLTVHDEPLFD